MRGSGATKPEVAERPRGWGGVGGMSLSRSMRIQNRFSTDRDVTILCLLCAWLTARNEFNIEYLRKSRLHVHEILVSFFWSLWYKIMNLRKTINFFTFGWFHLNIHNINTSSYRKYFPRSVLPSEICRFYAKFDDWYNLTMEKHDHVRFTNVTNSHFRYRFSAFWLRFQIATWLL